jgi:hypothetical protein
MDIPLKSATHEGEEEPKKQENSLDLSFHSKLNEQIQIILEENVPEIAFTMSDPVKHIYKIDVREISNFYGYKR